MDTEKSRRKAEERLEKTLEDSFPASDPPSHSGTTDVRKNTTPPPEDSAAGDAEPKGTPNADRYRAETAHVAETDAPASGKRPGPSKH